MKNLTVYVVTTPAGRTLVRTKPNLRWYHDHPGYTVTAARMNWKAARSIARTWQHAAEGK